MPLYNELDPAQRGKLKFLRYDDHLIVDKVPTAHRDTLIKDGIFDTFNRARLADKKSVDAGLIEITEDSIYLYDESSTLGVKVVPEVREKTIVLFKDQTTKRPVAVEARKSNGQYT